MKTENLVWVVVVPSAVSHRMCLLGEGASKAEAMADAYGPKPWPKSAKHADCYPVSEGELINLKEDRT